MRRILIHTTLCLTCLISFVADAGAQDADRVGSADSGQPVWAPLAREVGSDQLQDDDIGRVDFDVSCIAAVRKDFDDAVGMLHHMMYVEARGAFEQIARQDPSCAMAHWGIAMTLFQPLWPIRPSPSDLDRGSTAVARALELGVKTDRERSLVTATQAFYTGLPTTDWWSRLGRWAAAMELAFDRQPDDMETGAFYALSQLAIAPVSENRMAHQARAARVLLGLYEREPKHPGAVHYTIHANDVQDRANESLEVVRSYDDIAPSVPHALHMPTHIFVRLGAWPDVIHWNKKSAAAALLFPAGDAVSHHYSHGMDYLAYAFLQRGADAEAAAVIDEALSRSPHQGTFISAFHLAAMPARYAVERRQWEEAAATGVRAHSYLPWEGFWWPEAMSWFAKGLGAARTGDIVAARGAAARMEELRDQANTAGEKGFVQYIETDRLVLAGWIAHAEGDTDAAVARMREGIALGASIEKHPVSPGALYPPNEALGDLFMLVDRPTLALDAFTASLRIWPKRFHSLLGAARAADASGDTKRARAYFEELLDVVGDTDTQREGVAEARAFLNR
jgi:tetratricopeptide (TPR) repeat protein